jgi:hypothetical protein
LCMKETPTFFADLLHTLHMGASSHDEAASDRSLTAYIDDMEASVRRLDASIAHHASDAAAGARREEVQTRAALRKAHVDELLNQWMPWPRRQTDEVSVIQDDDLPAAPSPPAFLSRSPPPKSQHAAMHPKASLGAASTTTTSAEAAARARLAALASQVHATPYRSLRATGLLSKQGSGVKSPWHL